MGMLQTGNMARQPHTGSGRATFARRASALTWLVRSMMILCAAGCPKPMVQESIVKVSIGAPSVIDTLAGPVTYPVTYANAAEISLYPDDVTLATSGSVTGRVSVHGLGTSARNVTISNIRGNGSASIALAAGTASDASGNPAPRAVATKAFYAHAVLEPGSGFTAPTPQPPAIGSGAGADAKAIARWDVVPYQTFDDLFEIGVVAFHINGIDRVEFSLDGGPWTAVKEMTLNPRTNVVEYWVALDAARSPDGPVEVRAIAHPKKGIPRVLQGSLDEPLNVTRGMHSIPLWANAGGTLKDLILHVDSVNGNDDTGDGSLARPYASIARAGTAAGGQVSASDAVILRLAQGDYVLHKGTGGLSHVEQWTTIEPELGTSPSTVRMVGSETGALSSMRRVRFHRVAVRGVFRIPVRTLWFDDIDYDGMDLSNGAQTITKAWSPGGIWITDGTSTGSAHVLRGADFYRNHHVIECSASPFGSSPCTLYSRCDAYVLTEFHGDVWHWLVGTTEATSDAADANIIAYNVTAENFPTQGIFAEVHPNEVIGTPVYFNNVAFVDIRVNHVMEDDGDYRGGWWEVGTNHFIMRRVNAPTQVMRWNPEKYNTTMRNASITDCNFYAFTHTPLPKGTIFYNNHFTNPKLYGSWVMPDYRP